MVRVWRIKYEVALSHVISRGYNEKQDIAINDDDRKLFLTTAPEMGERFEIDLFAYVLMNNHYLLLFRTNSPFDIPGINTKASTQDILDAIRESRERFSEQQDSA